MSDPDVRALFLRAIAANDSAAMREGIECLFGLTGDGLSPEAEFLLRNEDYVMEMPQSGERIRGRDAMRAMQEAFPVPPFNHPAQSSRVRESLGRRGNERLCRGRVARGGRPGADADGSIVRDTRYYTQESEAPTWRAEWVEALD